MRIILVNWNTSQNTNVLIFNQILCIEPDTIQYEATFWFNLTKTTFLSKRNFKPLYILKSFVSQKFPYFRALIYEGLSSNRIFFCSVRLNVPGAVTVFFVKKKTIEWCSRKAFGTKKILQSYRNNITDILWTSFEQFLMTFQGATTILVFFSQQKNIDFKFL